MVRRGHRAIALRDVSPVRESHLGKGYRSCRIPSIDITYNEIKKKVGRASEVLRAMGNVLTNECQPEEATMMVRLDNQDVQERRNSPP